MPPCLDKPRGYDLTKTVSSREPHSSGADNRLCWRFSKHRVTYFQSGSHLCQIETRDRLHQACHERIGQGAVDPAKRISRRRRRSSASLLSMEKRIWLATTEKGFRENVNPRWGYWWLHTPCLTSSIELPRFRSFPGIQAWSALLLDILSTAAFAGLLSGSNI